MKFKSKTQEELETMSFDDLAYEILKEKGKKMKTADIFRIICEILNLSENDFEANIADFFTLLSTEKRFIKLDQGYWDLRENHTAKIEIDELEEDEFDESTPSGSEDSTYEENEEEGMYIDENQAPDDDTSEDDLKDLVVIDEENEVDL